MVKVFKFLILIAILLVSDVILSQTTNFNSTKNWRRNKKELILNVGPTGFLGDLGGRDMVGKDYSMADLDLKSTTFNVGFSYRYRFRPYFATSTIVTIGSVKGDDKLTLESARNARNLNFKSTIVSIYQRIEIMLYFKESFGHKYNFKGLK